MKKTRIRERILSQNDTLADTIRKRLHDNHTYSINVMASPGAGKTTLIENTVNALKDTHRILIVEGDVVDIDVKRLQAAGVDVLLANTGGACHLDAVMVTKALEKTDLGTYDLAIVENVGNLICPANFDIGTDMNIVIASVPEGHDKPYKYPGMFAGADIVLVNKYDYTDREAFDISYFERGVQAVSSSAHIIPISARTGDNMDAWYSWIKNHIAI